MLLKISLALAILVGLATLFFTGGISSKLEDLNGQVATLTNEKTTALDAQKKAQDAEKKARAANEEATKQLNVATNSLAAATTRLGEQERRANIASSNLVVVTEDRNLARQELNRWSQLGISPERVHATLEANKRMEAERVALNTELKTFSKKNMELENELAKYRNPDADVVLPAGTRGNVVAVDPKYDFVVLDIGGNQGLLTDAKMLVNRNGKLVSRVKITHVEPNRAIANVMPDWKVDDIIEGDQVVY
jgi:hypothetical protein